MSEKLLNEIQNLAKEYDIDRIVLFGSRARGDNKKTSDIDLAVSGGNIAAFTLMLEENTATLLKYDIVNLDKQIQEELLESIQKEGKTIYEKI